MKTYRINSIMAGALYLLGTIFGISGGIVGGKVLVSLITGVPLVGVDVLELAAADSGRLNGGALFTFLMGASLMAMTLFLYPIFRKDHEPLALGLVLFRGALEGALYFVTVLGILALIALGNEYVATGSSSTELQSMGNVLYQVIKQKTPYTTLVFLIGATCLYLSFYRTRLIPRWLSIWGFVGVVPYLANALLHYFQVNLELGGLLEMPLAFQELVMGAWLVIKGFNQSALAALEAKSQEGDA